MRPRGEVEVHSFLQAGAELVPIEEFAGHIADERYVEGAIELIVDGVYVLRREQVDYVDQLWAYLVTGLGEVAEGRAFSTFYPDMPVEVTLVPHRRGRAGRGSRGYRAAPHLLTMRVERKGHAVQIAAAADDVQRAMVTAATTFFTHMRRVVARNEPWYQRELGKLAKLAER